MADDKTVSLRIDGSQGEQALEGIDRAAEGAASSMGDLGEAITKTETNTKRLVGTSRDYNSAARSVGDSVQAITKFEAAYRASLTDTANSAQVRAQILAAAFQRNIGGAADEKRAIDLLGRGHKDAAAAVEFIIQNQAQFAATTNAAAQAQAVQATIVASNARGMGEYAAQLQAVARAQELNQQAAGRAGALIAPSGSGKSAGESAGVFASAFREEEAAANAAAQAESRALKSRLENERMSRTWEAALDAEARASREAAAAQESQAAQLRTLLGVYAPAAARSKTLAEHEQQLSALFASGAMTAQEHGAVLRNLQTQQAMNSAEMARMASGAKLNSYALTNLSYQVNDVITQYASGTPVQQIFAQQAGQFVQVFQQAGVSLTRFAGPLAALAVPLSVGGALFYELGKKGREAEAAIQAFSDVEKNLQPILEKTNDITKTSIELAKLKAQATKDATSASLKEQEAAANAAFLAQGQKVGSLKKQDADKGGGDYTSSETVKAEEELERVWQALQKISQAKKDLASQPPLRLADSLLTANQPKVELEAKRDDLQKGITDAAQRGDAAALERLTEAYSTVNRAIATYVTEGQRAVLLAEAQAKASTMSATEGQKYLSQRTAEINAMGKVIEQGELEQQQKAATIEANTAAAKSYGDMAKAISAANIESDAKLAILDLDTEREALAQRKTLGETSAAEELAQAISISDRKRQVEENAAQQKLALLRRTAGTERTEIEAAERAITELKKQHSLDRQKQIDEEVAARRAQAKQLALIAAEAEAASAGRKVDAKAEGLSMAQVTGDVTGAQAQADIERQLSQERYQIELDLLNKKLDLSSQEPVERAKILNEIKALEEKHANDIAKIDRQVTQNRISEIKSWVEPFKSALNTMVSSYISGTSTLKQIASRAWQSIAASYASKGIGNLFDKAATGVVTSVAGKGAASALGLGTGGANAAQTTAVTGNTAALHALTTVLTGNATATTSDTAATTANTAATTSDTVTSAANTAAEAASTGTEVAGLAVNTTGDATNTTAVAALTTAVAANTVAQGGSTITSLIPGFAVGAWDLPADQIAQVHQGEMIIPADTAPSVRSLLTAKGSALVSPSISSAISAINGRSIRAVMSGTDDFSTPRFAMPTWLNDGPVSSESVTSSSSSVTNRGGDTHVTIGSISASSAVNRATIMSLKEAVCEAVASGVKNGDPNALYVARKKVG